MSEVVELTSSALLVLHDLKDDPKPAKRYPEDDLEELRKTGFVSDLPGGGIGITKDGLDHLMPPGKPRPYVPPAQRANGATAPTPPVTEPPASPVVTSPSASQSPKLVGSSFVLAALKKAGGSMTRDKLNADGRTLRKLIQDGQVIEEGDSIRLAKAGERVPAAPPPHTATTVSVRLPPPAAEPPAPAPASIPTTPIETHACTEGDCTTCATGRALAFLTSSSPTLAAMVERFQAHEADQQRLKSFDS